MKREPHFYSIEKLVHYQCSQCRGWWSIGDGPTGSALYCPWCGYQAQTAVDGGNDE